MEIEQQWRFTTMRDNNNGRLQQCNDKLLAWTWLKSANNGVSSFTCVCLSPNCLFVFANITQICSEDHLEVSEWKANQRYSAVIYCMSAYHADGTIFFVCNFIRSPFALHIITVKLSRSLQFMTTGSCQWKIGLFIWIQLKIILYRINWQNSIIYEYDKRIIVTSDFILIGFSRKTTQHTKSLLHVVEPLIITYRCFRCFPKAGINYSENAFVARRGNQWLVKAAGDKISRPGSVGGQGPVNDCPRRAERTAPRHATPRRAAVFVLGTGLSRMEYSQELSRLSVNWRHAV